MLNNFNTEYVNQLSNIEKFNNISAGLFALGSIEHSYNNPTVIS